MSHQVLNWIDNFRDFCKKTFSWQKFYYGRLWFLSNISKTIDSNPKSVDTLLKVLKEIYNFCSKQNFSQHDGCTRKSTWKRQPLLMPIMWYSTKAFFNNFRGRTALFRKIYTRIKVIDLVEYFKWCPIKFWIESTVFEIFAKKHFWDKNFTTVTAGFSQISQKLLSPIENLKIDNWKCSKECKIFVPLKIFLNTTVLPGNRFEEDNGAYGPYVFSSEHYIL